MNKGNKIRKDVIQTLVIPIIGITAYFINAILLIKANYPQSLRLLFIPDPSYAYLFNGFNIFNGFRVGHVDHPGTSLQLIIGLFLTLTNWRNSASDIQDTIVNKSDEIIYQVQFAILASQILIFILIAIFQRKSKYNYFIMLAPFFLINGYSDIRYWTILAPDSIAITLILVMVLILLSRGDILKTKSSIILGLIFGTLIFTKLNSLPYILIVFLIPRKMRINFGVGFAFSVVILSFAIRESLPQMISFWNRMLFNSGRFGESEKFIDSQLIMENIFNIGRIYPILILTIIMFIELIVLRKYNKKNLKISNEKNIIIFGTITIAGIILTARADAQHYFLPFWVSAIYTLYFILEKMTIEIGLTKNKILVSMLNTAIFLVLVNYQYMNLFIRYSAIISLILVLSYYIIKYLQDSSGSNIQNLPQYLVILYLILNVISISLQSNHIYNQSELKRVQYQNVALDTTINGIEITGDNIPLKSSALFFGNNFALGSFTKSIEKNFNRMAVYRLEENSKQEYYLKLFDLNGNTINCVELFESQGDNDFDLIIPASGVDDFELNWKISLDKIEDIEYKTMKIFDNFIVYQIKINSCDVKG